MSDPARYRRSPYLVAHWQGAQVLIENYATATTVEASPLVLDVLDRFSEWQDFESIAAQLPRIPATLLRDLVQALVGHGALDVITDAAAAHPLDTWAPWNPAAGFFHQSTKDVKFTPKDETNARLKARAKNDPLPPPLKPPYPGKHVALPAPRRQGAFPQVLLDRRTWRRFGSRPLQLEELATLLGLTWGVQAWMEIDGWGRMPLKTAPSGGARHSIEAYVVARRVSGLRPGIYHYQPASHELHLVRASASANASRAAIVSYLPQQPCYGDASALVLMSSVFSRVQWRYGFPRAYRTVLAEAGHHCQNFCLAATWLGLAPFCTMALADSRIERDLQIDGVTESVLYAAGVAPRPAATAWAPWARTTATPKRTLNPLGKAVTKSGRKATGR
jgi:SagB-type dehydrogenase family enzyme